MSNIGDEIRAKYNLAEMRKWNQEFNAERKDREMIAERVAKLEAGNYPLRAIDGIDAMTGAGLEKAQQLAPYLVKKAADSILLLLGDRGCGKTQIATWLASSRVAGGFGAGIYAKAFDLLAEIKQSWSGRGVESEILRRYRTTSFLVIDEFQERSESDWDNRTLTNIIDHRYDRRLATLLIANLTPDEASKHIPRSILSRCQETGGIIECGWGSYRERTH